MILLTGLATSVRAAPHLVGMGPGPFVRAHFNLHLEVGLGSYNIPILAVPFSAVILIAHLAHTSLFFPQLFGSFSLALSNRTFYDDRNILYLHHPI